MMNEIYRFKISPDTVCKITNQVASEVSLAEIIPTANDVTQIIENISENNHRKPVLFFLPTEPWFLLRHKKRADLISGEKQKVSVVTCLTRTRSSTF
ncbi:hypothetical protein [Desulfogranum marinum]|uniref:hypothetical protein n=1 Tax=Desulfogranum marinum TaxID=453220 RepID=UPI00196480E1|nr:hypothetical protein [Desulfogranum marinum]MBM9513710.1 hypothetical protein [Desulfogranum marinum]